MNGGGGSTVQVITPAPRNLEEGRMGWSDGGGKYTGPEKWVKEFFFGIVGLQT